MAIGRRPVREARAKTPCSARHFISLEGFRTSHIMSFSRRLLPLFTTVIIGVYS